MSRSQRERRCEASRPLRAAGPIVPAPGNAAGLATAQARSTLRCLRKPPPPAASGLVVDGIVFDGRPPGLAVPDGDGAGSLRPEHDLADRVADELRAAALRNASSSSLRR